MSLGGGVRLVATDLDGTLLDDRLTVSPRTRAALDAVRAAGIVVVPVTARQPRGTRMIAEQGGFTEWALCGNGAQCVHLGTGEVMFEAYVDVAVQRAVAEALADRVPGVLFVSVREAGEVFVAQDGYAAIADFEDHKRDPATMGGHALAAVVAEPSLKFVVRHAERTPDELVAEVRALGLGGFAVTHSGAPFIEILAEGVNKAWGVAQLCERFGIDRSEVLAFGDAPNDAELLAWAGRGIAMANAHPEARDAADETTLSNAEDGVAIVLEQLLEPAGSGTAAAG
ncbi:HAD family hydrolase [Microlunatus speluncae]|uniref:HAD family hydrolase n=1 Tax=Microlunatus speluncae TaxID=2594267 RepID=UPI001C2D107E|nr:HAD family hydrolase [Microlunatus speluncae]